MRQHIPFLFSSLTAALVLLPASAHATPPTLRDRCAADSLDVTQAKARLEWARRCGSIVNVGSPTNPKPGAEAYDTTLSSTTPGVTLWEYLEASDPSGLRSYSGDYISVNGTFTQQQYRVGPTDIQTADGGFQKWTRKPVFELARPNYPIFGTVNSVATASPLYPNVNTPGDCNLYTPSGVVATTFYVMGYCESSCYTPDMVIRFADGEHSILDSLNALRTGVAVVAPTSTLDQIKLTTDDVATYTRDIFDAKQVVFEIRSAAGGLLRVTDKHPIIVGDGRIVEAASIKVGDELIRADGKRDAVVSSTKTEYFGKVYNLKPVTTDLVSNILVAQGFLVGSSRYQNEDVDYINRIIFGRGIPVDVIPR